MSTEWHRIAVDPSVACGTCIKSPFENTIFLHAIQMVEAIL